ncbi:hypothetical protein PBRA_003559 [Plasmodiophora brassicae]|uniref:Protein OSCP1 n=1 Tax=Plasmodiophora brassicae TaxID=37360 RepID=A0A0G4IHP1_PLABS|nr:hypothetical protein PBRA_003559 [Plasmodiophora brassicae]
MALLCMPILVINMGGEMIYIIDQRLKAQSISGDKSIRVLEDVVSTMFNPKFVDEIFKPKPIYTNDALQQIFRRLAHSSIMRLNETSMEKLYDLMTMGFKYQVLSCTVPSDLLKITVKHLNTLMSLFPSSAHDSAAYALINRTMQLVAKVYDNLRDWELAALRYRLAMFFQDRKVKVSLLLQDNLQSQTGAIIISHVRRVSSPAGKDLLGTVNVYKQQTRLERVVHLSVPGRDTVGEAFQPKKPDEKTPAAQAPVLDRPTSRQSVVSCALGSNIYELDRQTSDPSAAAADHDQPSNQATPAQELQAPVNQQAVACLDLLAGLIQAPADIKDNSFKLDLGMTLGTGSDASDGQPQSSFHVQKITINASQNSSSAIADWGPDEGTTTKPTEDDQLDLLAMMTSLEDGI